MAPSKFLLFVVSLIFVVSFSEADAQLRSVAGRIMDSESKLPLLFGNVKVTGTTHGTSANKNGFFELKLTDGEYKISASYIGYLTDTITVKVNGDVNNVDFYLRQTNIVLPEVTVTPGENPALAIVRKAIERKKVRNTFLESFEFGAYTKGIIKTEDDIKSDDNRFSLSVGISDSADLIISGIIENQSRGYYKKPGKYKEVIIARKQTSNFPSSVNVLTGGRLIQNFYEDDISFLGQILPGPLSDNALEYYDFYIMNTAAMDKYLIYSIHMAPRQSSDPGFIGEIFIKDSTHDLVKVDLQLNRAANRGGLFDSINVFQQFADADKGIYMPVDYRLFAEASVLSLARFGFELGTIMYDYQINPGLTDAFFDKAVLSVLPEADNKDSLYWNKIPSIPPTYEEVAAYQRIDSLSKIPLSFWDEFSILSSKVKLSDAFYITAPLGMYHFNRVEGHALDFGLYAEDFLNSRLNSSLVLSYGFADKKMKMDFSGSYLAGSYRTTAITIGAYDKVKVLFGDSENYNELTATLLALVSKYEFRDYYYSKGFNLNISGEIAPVLSLSGGFTNYNDVSAFNSSNFSFFAKDREYRINSLINDVSMNEIKLGFRLDFRNYIEDGYFRRRISEGKSYGIFAGNIIHSNDTWLNSSMRFTQYDFSLSGVLNSFGSTAISFRLLGLYTDGDLPYQSLYSVPGNIDFISQNFTFRTLEVNEILGEKVFSLNLEYNLRDEVFRWLNVPLLKSSEIQLKTFFNAVYSEIDERSRSFFPVLTVNELATPFYEGGFGLGHILIPMQLEFAWKLNHRGINNFRISLNSFVF